MHMVLEDTKPVRSSTIKKTCAVGCHLEPTKGSKNQAEAYITKSPPYDEKGEEVLCIVRVGEIRANPGKRNDLDMMEALIEDGLTPQEIFDQDLHYRRYEEIVKKAYIRKRWLETPTVRDVAVHLLVGDSGTGKTYTYVQLCEQYGGDNVCLITDYATNGGFDSYVGQELGLV